MKESFLMRVLFCKIQCPFICFCKPSAAHIYTSGPLKLENAPHIVPPIAFAISSDSSDNSSSETGNVLKSCIKKVPSDGFKEAEKKRVTWMDNLGKELTEIREFESSETWDTDNEEENSRCLCVIL